MIEDAERYKLQCRLAESAPRSDAFFTPLPQLRKHLKNLVNAAAAAKLTVTPALLSGRSARLLRLDRDVRPRLADLRARFAADAAPVQGPYRAEYCDDIEAVMVFEQLPYNCAQPFGAHVRDVVSAMRNAEAEVATLWGRGGRDDTADAVTRMLLVEQLQGRRELEYVLKFVSPRARVLFNAFALEVKVAVAADACRKTARPSGRREVDASMLRKVFLGHTDACDVAD